MNKLAVIMLTMIGISVAGGPQEEPTDTLVTLGIQEERSTKELGLEPPIVEEYHYVKEAEEPPPRIVVDMEKIAEQRKEREERERKEEEQREQAELKKQEEIKQQLERPPQEEPEEIQTQTVEQPIVEEVIAESLEEPAETESVANSDVGLLAQLVSAEATGEPYSGKVAVAEVVINRTRSGEFPANIQGVIYQPGQFSPVADGSINNAASSEDIQAAQEALNGSNYANGSLYFYNPVIATSRWLDGLPTKTIIGSHYFK